MKKWIHRFNKKKYEICIYKYGIKWQYVDVAIYWSGEGVTWGVAVQGQENIIQLTTTHTTRITLTRINQLNNTRISISSRSDCQAIQVVLPLVLDYTIHYNVIQYLRICITQYLLFYHTIQYTAFSVLLLLRSRFPLWYDSYFIRIVCNMTLPAIDISYPRIRMPFVWICRLLGEITAYICSQNVIFRYNIRSRKIFLFSWEIMMTFI